MTRPVFNVGDKIRTTHKLVGPTEYSVTGVVDDIYLDGSADEELGSFLYNPSWTDVQVEILERATPPDGTYIKFLANGNVGTGVVRGQSVFYPTLASREVEIKSRFLSNLYSFEVVA